MPFIPYYRRKTEGPSHDRFDKTNQVVAIVGVVVLAITAGVIAWQTIEIQRSVGEAKQQLHEMQAEQRPWLYLNSVTVDSPLFYDSAGLGVRLAYKIENAGHMVAPRTQIYASTNLVWTDKPPGSSASILANKSLKPAPGKYYDAGNGENLSLADITRKLCASEARIKSIRGILQNMTEHFNGLHKDTNYYDVGNAVFPYGENPGRYNIVLPRKDEATVQQPKGTQSYLPELTICIRYSDKDGNLVGETRYSYILGGMDKDDPYLVTTLDPTLTKIEASNLRLVEVGRYAD
jgi:hypothetical protein